MQFNETGLLISVESAKLLLMVAVATSNKTLLGMEGAFQWLIDVGTAEIFPNPEELTMLRYMYNILPELRP